MSRTYLPNARLSEDIDLIAVAPRTQVAAVLQDAIGIGLARSHGSVSWRPALSQTTGSQPAVLATGQGVSVQVQLVPGAGYSWPTEIRDLLQRYSDVPPAQLQVLTAAGAAAAKLTAWIERRAPRDLYDMWALAEAGLITPEAVAVFSSRGPFGRPPEKWLFNQPIEEHAWRTALGHQTRLTITADQARYRVARAWQEATDRTAS